jgi:hypothetical protein
LAQLSINSSQQGSSFKEILLAADIEPGDEPSYQLCKLLYEYHPIGKKMVDVPIEMAQSQERIINIQKGPEEKVRNAFIDQWRKDGADDYIANTMRLARIYGVSAIAIKVKGKKDDTPLDFESLADAQIAFSVFDPLNIAGSVVLNQQPNEFDFLKTTGIVVQGQPYHESRTKIVTNEKPIYLAYTSSSFGYVGRSVYQRALFPLKSFIQTMITDDMITLKSGVIVAKMKRFGAIIDQVMQMAAGIKRAILQQAQTGNVISIDAEEAIETLNMQNLDGAYGMARKHILQNIASSAPMPAKILEEETFAEGFGEGTEDAKYIARYINRFRVSMNPLYGFFDKIVQYRAWNKDFYETIQNEFRETYKGVDYQTAFQEWRNSFVATWPNLLEEPDSEKVKVDDVKLKAIVAWVEVLLPALDPENKARLIEWACDNFNDFEMLFGSPLDLDYEALASYEPPVMAGGEGGPQSPKPEAPFSSKDSDIIVDGEKYTVEMAEEWGMGQGPNGTGKRRKVKGFYVVSPRGRRVHAFEVNSVKTEEIQRRAAQEWANKMTQALENGERWAMQ